MADCYGAIEAGGTKFVCAVGSGPEDIRAQVRLATTTPGETLDQVIAFFKSYRSEMAAIGIASFGPLDLDSGSPTHGFITSTPKHGWINTDIVGPIRAALDLPIGFDTDVNGAAMGEGRWGAAQGLDTFIYLTIGTGIGGGGVIAGKCLHGLLHPEMGHIHLPHDWDADPFEGTCPFHGDCFEGLACGPAIQARWGQPAETLPLDHVAWELEARYISLAVASLVCALSPQRIILGGGVMKARHLFPRIRQGVRETLNEYINVEAITKEIDRYLVPPALGDRSGVLGALVLAEEALHRTV